LRLDGGAGRAPDLAGKFNPVKFDAGEGRAGVGDTGWLIVAIVSGVLTVVGWIARERWIMRRRRRRR
jgi:hypothetical protein